MPRRYLPLGLLVILLPVKAFGAPGSRVEELSIASDEVKLSASISLPAGPGPFPAVVLLPGSGCTSREALALVIQSVTEAGYAAVHYDKRGCGGSTGAWERASLLDLAADAAAVARRISARGDIDRGHLGLWCISQSGWYAPIVAARDPDVSFLAVVTGGGASPRDVEWWGYESALSRLEVKGQDLDDAHRLIAQYFAYLATGEHRDLLDAAIARAKGSPWYAALPLERVLPTEDLRPRWAWVATYDPVPDIERLHIPVLLLFGGNDPLTPTEESLARWTLALKRSGHAPFTIRVFPEAGHGLVIGEHHQHKPGEPLHYAVGALETTVAWLKSLL